MLRSMFPGPKRLRDCSNWLQMIYKYDKDNGEVKISALFPIVVIYLLILWYVKKK